MAVVPVSRPCYCTREDVKRALDIKGTARNDWQVDRAIQAASDDIDSHMHRQFYPLDTTAKIDWPNWQRAYPWRIWLDAAELADVTVTVPTVTSGGVTIPNSAIFWGPWNYAPPFTFFELDRSQSYAFGGGSTPQQAVHVTGTRGYWLKTDAAGTLASAISDTTGTTITVTDASVFGVGDLLVIDTERFLVTERAMAQAGSLVLSGTGVTTAVASDVTLSVGGSGTLHVGEVILIDAERMLIVDVSGSSYVVKRGWDGTVLATHSATAAINALRSVTVTRGEAGSTAASHSSATAINRYRAPGKISELAIAEACNTVQQQLGGYSDPQGESGASLSNLGAALADLWDEAETGFARKNRKRVI